MVIPEDRPAVDVVLRAVWGGVVAATEDVIGRVAWIDVRCNARSAVEFAMRDVLGPVRDDVLVSPARQGLV